MSRFNQWFRRGEFECKCGCGQDTVDAELIKVLTKVRLHYGSPVVINSGNRCWHHNEVIGGSPKSKHPLGKAADFYVKEHNIGEVYQWMLGVFDRRYGLGLYVKDKFIHLDVRPTQARWVKE